MPSLSADDLCEAVEAILIEHLPALAASRDLSPVATWDQLPTADALAAAVLPAGAITCPGLTGPSARRSGGYDATWRIAVGVFDRGATYRETATKTRTWAAVIRQVLVQHPTLGGLASGLAWVGEEYAERPERSSARTLGGCAVAFDVTARNVIDLNPYSLVTPGGPIVTSTFNTVTVRPPNTQE